MARIIYGVHGTGHGHAMRALAVARHFGRHEFLFVSHGDGAALLRKEFRVAEIPNPVTVVAGHRVRGWETLKKLLEFTQSKSLWQEDVRRVFEEFRADLAMADYEYFVPRVARRLGLPCISLDHQHIVPFCGDCVPFGRAADYRATVWAIRRLFSESYIHLVTSFFEPPCPPSDPNTRIVPPLLRDPILKIRPRDDGHVLAYQGYSTFRRFISLLKQIPHPVVVYGLPHAGQDGNLRYKRANEQEFLQDLAGCRYVICGGGHGLISEALYLGKPVISFPIRQAIEQYLNAWHVRHLGYGLCMESFSPPKDWINGFETRYDEFRAAIRHDSFEGNGVIYAEIEKALSESKRVVVV